MDAVVPGLVNRVEGLSRSTQTEEVVVSFPDINGRFEYTGFTSTNERSIRWCEELCLHFWERGTPKREYSFS